MLADKFKYSIFLLIVLLLNACAGPHQSNPAASGRDNAAAGPEALAYREKIAALKNDLASLNGHPNSAEAGWLAETAISYSYQLAEKYRVVRPAIFHNLLVRIGLKDRGLCYQWTEDLMNRLYLMQLKSFQLHWGVAYRGSELREHNTVVVTARGQPFEEGIVLDPWRNSGELFWARVKNDRYPWQKRMPGE
ncbi:MAG: hypothetical protein P8X90_12280 [Desulfobacterales bacterium]